MSISLPPDLYEKIRIKAYLLWEAAGNPEGDGHQFWVEAEKIMTRMANLNEAKKAKALMKTETELKVKGKTKKGVTPILISEAKPGKKQKKKKEKSDKRKPAKAAKKKR